MLSCFASDAPEMAVNFPNAGTPVGMARRGYLRQGKRLVESSADSKRAYAESSDEDKSAASSRCPQYNRRDRHADHPSHDCRRAEWRSEQAQATIEFCGPNRIQPGTPQWHHHTPCGELRPKWFEPCASDEIAKLVATLLLAPRCRRCLAGCVARGAVDPKPQRSSSRQLSQSKSA